MLGETFTPSFQTHLSCSGEQTCMNLLKWQQDLEALISTMLKKSISPLSMQISSRKKMVKKKPTNKNPPTNIFPQHRNISAGKSTYLRNLIELFQWNVFSLICSEVKPCPCRHSSQHKPRHQNLGQGRQVRKETSIFGTPRPNLCHCHLLQLSHSISQTGPFTIPTCCPVSLHKTIQGWSTTRLGGQTLRFSSFPWSP